MGGNSVAARRVMLRYPYSGLPAGVLLPFLRCLERSPRIIPPEPLWESSSHSPGGAGPPGPLPGISGRITGSAREEPDPAPYGRSYNTTDQSPACMGVAMYMRAWLINTCDDVREMGVPYEKYRRGFGGREACPPLSVGVPGRRACALGGGGAAMAHGHGPGRCRCCGEEAAERGAAWGLYLRIDRQRLQCLNERREGSGATVFRPWEERGDRSQFVESDDDEELLFNIPFTGSVKLKGVIVMGEDDGTHPAEMRLFRNIPHMSFDDTAKEPEQTFSLSRDPLGELEYPTKIARFSNVYHLSMHFPKNFGAETTKIFYIGLKGEWTEAHRHEVTICNYEASANPADHKLEQITPQTHFIS